MDHRQPSEQTFVPLGFLPAPIHPAADAAPLRLCVVVRTAAEDEATLFTLLRDLPSARVYLGALCDAAGRIQDWLEIWVQDLDLRDLVLSDYHDQLTNQAFDQRWQVESHAFQTHLAERVIVTGMESENPAPLLVKRSATAGSAFLVTEPTRWRICKDDALLTSRGLPPYSSSAHRYLYDPTAQGPQTFLAASADAPVNAHVQGIERLNAETEALAVFNPRAGLVRVTRLSPLGLDELLEILEGQEWSGAGPVGPRGVYRELQHWSAQRKGVRFLLHAASQSPGSLQEALFLKLSLLLGAFTEVRNYVRDHQLPLLNVAPASFAIHLEPSGAQFPVLWTARCVLVRPGQAQALRLKSTEQRYFIRLGRVEPTPFLPQSVGAHSFGIGSVRLRNLATEASGTVLEGTLVAEDYLGLDPHDLLWFRLPLGQERLEFCAHVYTSEAAGPKEARFRTTPAQMAEATLAQLKRAAGTVFPRSPYEIWPLLSSPSDLYSLAILAIRVLLANHQTKLAEVVDDFLSLSRHLGKLTEEKADPLPALRALLDKDPRLLDLVSPHRMIADELSPAQARNQVHLETWLETILMMLRLIPGGGPHCYCKSFGDVSPVALETVFDEPIQVLEGLVQRVRSTLVPSLHSNQEIANVLLEFLQT